MEGRTNGKRTYQMPFLGKGAGFPAACKGAGTMACRISDYDIYLFHQGNLAYSYRMLGAHRFVWRGVQGVRFTVWAPNARQVAVVGAFNQWRGEHHQMRRINAAGIWTLFMPHIGVGELYKYEITGPDGEVRLKADPYAFWAEAPPQTASRVADLNGYMWQDAPWMAQRKSQAIYKQPLNIYEVHLGSWRRSPDGDILNYRQLADELAAYASQMGYTHVELLPVAEHPYDGSWGYQITGYYAVTSRYGSPQDFMYFVDTCHRHGLGVILDWVPGHFCRDEHGLVNFDGLNLYEHGDPTRAVHPEWGTLHFDYGRNEVRSFLISNAVFWFDVYHVDGLRIDAVSSMILNDHGRKPGEWAPNKDGGNTNLEAIAFLQQLNTTVFKHYPDVLMIAEEATDFSQVSHPVHEGGLGFNYKWNMGWMNDTLEYMRYDPIYRKQQHSKLTFSLMYAFSENFLLPLSHDEVVHGKRSLLDKMPGDTWQKFAGLRLLLGYMMAHPGKKLLFMGGEFGQYVEWKYYTSLDWHLLEYPAHQNTQRWVHDLNWFYKQEAALWELDHSWAGFGWIEPHADADSLLIFWRQANNRANRLIVICNFTPVVRFGYRIGVPEAGAYIEVLNSDAQVYGGTGRTHPEPIVAELIPWQGQPYSLCITVPPLAIVFLRRKEIRRP